MQTTISDDHARPIVAQTRERGGIHIVSAGRSAMCLNARELTRLIDFANANNAERIDGATVVTTPAKRHAQLLRYTSESREEGQS